MRAISQNRPISEENRTVFVFRRMPLGIVEAMQAESKKDTREA